MTSYLLDTHSLLWFMAGDEHLSRRAREIMEDVENSLLLSTASLWKIAIKVSLGKLPLNEPYETLIPRQLRQLGIDVVQPEIADYVAVTKLPFHHRDPFDRLIIAQALQRELPIVGRDLSFGAYGVQMQW